MKKLLLIALLSMTGLYMTGQTLEDTYQVQPPQVIPSSPQAKMFDKYINHEVTEYNGLPVIEIPLYEIEIKGLKIPITLSYHAGGVKYMEYDGDVAAGWSVNAGGYRVSRTIMGKADEAYPMYKESDFNKWAGLKSRDALGYMASIIHETGTADEYMSWCIDQKESLDGEYDHFNYMLPGGGGQFLIVDRDEQIKRYIANTNPLNKVILANTQKLSLDDMSIIDRNGFTYYMGKHPASSDVLTECYRPTGYKTGWPLRQIRSPYNETVEFSYVKFDVSHDRTDILQDDYHTYSIKETSSTSYPGGGGLDIEVHSAEASFAPTFVNSYGSKYETCFISEIRTDKEIVEFVRYKYDSHSPAYVLKEIRIKTISGEERKRISFSYNDFAQPHRLLEKIIVDNHIYNFTYYDSPGDIQFLYSDVWGYYKKAEQSNSWLNYMDERYKDDIIMYMNSASNDYPMKLKDITGWKNMIEWVDRESNGETTHAFSLKAISYPTGGVTEYIYEPNQYKDTYEAGQPIITGGGQRIKKIISRADGSSKPIISLFKYGLNENGYGEMHMVPNYIRHDFVSEHTFQSFWNHIGITIASNIVTIKNYSSRKPFNSDLYSNVPVTYSQISKYQYDEENSGFNGKTVSFYNTLNNTPYSVSSLNYQSLSNVLNHNILNIVNAYYLGKKAIPDSLKIFDKENNLLKKEIYAYTTTHGIPFSGVKIKQIASYKDVSRPGTYYQLPESLPVYPFVYKALQTFVGTDLLTNKTTTTYDGGKAITTVQTNQYTSKNQLSQVTQSGSATGSLVKNYKYPQDYSTTPYPEMVTKNMISSVIEQITLNNGTEIGRIKTDYYKDANNLILPQKVQTSASGINGLRTDIMYDSYDIKGNLLQYTCLDGIKVSYLWSYNYKYPVAEIVNADYSTVSSALGINTTTLAQNSNPDATAISKIKSLNTALPQAHVTVLTYKPLIGTTSLTTPAGTSTGYEYNDPYWRLTDIKDHDNQLINKYSYNLPYNDTNYITDIFLSTKTYRTGETSKFTCIVKGGSSTYNYNWTIKNASGQVLHSYSTPGNFMNAYEVALTNVGNMTVSCNVTSGSTSKNTSKDFEVKYALPKVSVDPYSTVIRYYSGESGTFRATASSGTGNFSYSWVLTNSTGAVLANQLNSSNNIYTLTLPQSGDLKLICTVKDNISQETVSASYDIKAYYLKVSKTFPSATAYQLNDNASFSLNVVRGSGSYSYVWNLVDIQSNTIIHTQEGTSNRYVPPMATVGTYKVTCTTKDIASGEFITEESLPFSVYAQVFDLGNQVYNLYSYDEEVATYIYLERPATLTFQAVSSVHLTDLNVSFTIGSYLFSPQYPTLDYSETRSIFLPAGNHYINIKMNNYWMVGNPSAAEATLRVIKSESLDTYVVPSSITAKWNY
ncbi:MAG: hypothetical protein ACK5M3_16835 [Dysgonomonas sp.]